MDALYFIPMAKEPTIPRPSVADRVTALEKDVERLTPGNWIKRNWWWITAIAGVVIWVGKWVLPNAIDSALNSKVDATVTAKLATPLEDLKKLKTDVGADEQKLSKLDGKIEEVDTFLQGGLRRKASLSPTQLRNQLPETNALLKSAAVLQIPPAPELAHLTATLRETDHAAPDFWPTAATLINYRTSTAVTRDSQFPNCSKVHQQPNMNPLVFTFVMSHCTLYPDHLTDFYDGMPQNLVGLRQALLDLTLTDGVIVYQGGPTIRTLGIQAKNCVIVLDIGPSPSQPAKRVVDSLLEADLKQFSCTLAG